MYIIVIYHDAKTNVSEWHLNRRENTELWTLKNKEKSYWTVQKEKNEYIYDSVEKIPCDTFCPLGLLQSKLMFMLMRQHMQMKGVRMLIILNYIFFL